MIKSLSNRSNYKALEDFIYLNQASLGLISEKSINSMHLFLDDVGRHGNSKMTDEEEIAFLDPLRKHASTLLNCSPDHLAILSSASEMLNQLPYLLKPAMNSNIILVSTDFPALFRPWLAFSEKESLKLVFVEEKNNKNLTETIMEKIDNKTSTIVVSYVQYSTGSIIDVNMLGKKAKAHGVKLIVDVTQAAGALPIDFKSWNCDAIICSGYKWLGGHGGVGLAALSYEIVNKTPLTPGWMGAENPFDISFSNLSLANSAKRYTQSTMSYVSIKGLEISIKELLKIGTKNIESHSRKLSKFLLDQLKKTSWFPYHYDNKNLSSPNIISIQNQNDHSQNIVNLLYQKKIICSYRNNKLRISIAHFNNEGDIKEFVRLLRLMN